MLFQRKAWVAKHARLEIDPSDFPRGVHGGLHWSEVNLIQKLEVSSAPAALLISQTAQIIMSLFDIVMLDCAGMNSLDWRPPFLYGFTQPVPLQVLHGHFVPKP